MGVSVELSCPLGHKCEDARDGKLIRCAWFVQMRGVNPSTGAETDEHGCAMSWMPVLMVENSRQQRGTAAAVESFRNEMVSANEASRTLLAAGALPLGG